MGHWKKTFDKDWIGAYVLPLNGNPDNGDRSKKIAPSENPYGKIIVTLNRVEVKEAKVGIKTSKHRIAYFAENNYFNKPMLVNQAVNLNRLSALIGSLDIDDWKDLNLKVTLQAEWSQIPSGGYNWALRIAKSKPVKPKLTPKSDKWDGAIKALAAGNVTIEKIKETYDITKKDEEILNGAV